MPLQNNQPTWVARYSRSFSWLILAWVLWQVLIFLLSNQDGQDSGGLSAKLLGWLQAIGIFPQGLIAPETASMILRKLAHFTEFAILGWLTGVLAYRLIPGSWILPCFLYVVLYAISDEVHQAFVPGRGPAVADVLVDSTGAGTAILGYALYLRNARNHRP